MLQSIFSSLIVFPNIFYSSSLSVSIFLFIYHLCFFIFFYIYTSSFSFQFYLSFLHLFFLPFSYIHFKPSNCTFLPKKSLAFFSFSPHAHTRTHTHFFLVPTYIFLLLRVHKTLGFKSTITVTYQNKL
jgi:hypothetical protein